jgi:hypothetical protein
MSGGKTNLPSVTANKGAFPPPSNITWNPTTSPKHVPNEPKIQLPGMNKSKSTGAIPDDGDRVVISQYGNKMPVVTYTDKGGNKSVKNLGSPTLSKLLATNEKK